MVSENWSLDEARQFNPHEQRDDATLIVARCKHAVTNS